ncbi:hypothetical protein DAPPUDRAFT_253730 [Daphnia pulex]|uniref:Uncharacterized protein n=1 Tax=Daphnia pulex TaxID=6669 RepID=E9H5R6_DAPPU|nr:hypothetical protein DAPPUDRAFT_253730 [Daphnia pulex]|eukprot:EFX72916.1 hypothetical protein DAPPUDRAFT_253730 [Daphnia pulex]
MSINFKWRRRTGGNKNEALALILLSICVAMSHQQYFHPRMMMGLPWMSPFAQHPMYFNNSPHYPYTSDVESPDNDVQSRETVQNRLVSGISSSSTSIGNPFVKTFTFTISSTCTALSVTTCVAISNLSPNPVACNGRRRRFAEYNDEQGEDIAAQYPIIPSEVRIVMPTEEPSSGLTRPSRQLPFGISSSIDDENEIAGIGKQQRDKRFFQQFWNIFATAVTVILLGRWFRAPSPRRWLFPASAPSYLVCRSVTAFAELRSFSLLNSNS